MSIAAHALSFLSLVVITLNLAVWCLPLIVLALAKPLLPFARRPIDRAMDGIYRIAVAVDDAWLRGVVGIDWDRPALGLRPDESVLVISNHLSWADILMIQSVIAREGPILKFLSKRELIFVPILGLIFWAFEFPLLRRRASKGESEDERRVADLLAIQEACRAVHDRSAGLISFVEGTRFTEAKRQAGGAVYRHLLKPRAGGFSTLLDGLDGAAERVIDLTLIYPGPASLWSFLAGRQRRIRVIAESIPISDIPRGRSERAEWLAERWERKDRAIERARADRDAGESGASP